MKFLRHHHPEDPSEEYPRRHRGWGWGLHFQRGEGHHGPRHGGGWGPGGRGGGGPRARRGALRFILLEALRSGPRHGYEIIKVLEEKTNGQYAPSPGTVYPTLQYLEELGFVRADAATERRVYHLTDAGRAELETHTEEVKLFFANFTGAVSSAACQHEVRFLSDEMEDLSRTVWSGLEGALRQGDKETIRRMRQAIEQCQNEIRRIITDGPTDTPSVPGEEEL